MCNRWDLAVSVRVRCGLKRTRADVTCQRRKPAEVVPKVPELGACGRDVMFACACPPDIDGVHSTWHILDDKGVVLDKTFFAQSRRAEEADAKLDQLFPLEQGKYICCLPLCQQVQCW